MWSLYRRLIERLYSDTEAFDEKDLMPQMHLRAFFFATDCIENEMKPLCPNDRATKIRLISEIMNDPICERFYGHIPVDQLNPLLQEYYRLIHERKAEEVIDFTEKYRKNEHRKNKYWKPFVAWITEAPVIGSVYKAVRNRK